MLDGQGELALVLGAYAAGALARDTSVRINKLLEHLNLLVVNVLYFIGAKVALHIF